MKDPFHYIPPTPETAPKYAAIRTAEAAAAKAIDDALYGEITGQQERAAAFGVIGAAAKSFHDLIESTCPPCADTSAALRCCRLARMAANEQIVTGESTEAARRMAMEQLRLARWQACAAIALADAAPAAS